MENPFSSPQTAAATDAGDFSPLAPDRERLAKLGEVFVAWEQLRVWYNVVLAVVALAAVSLVDLSMLARQNSLESMALAAFAANLCFCFGPLVEGYVTWFIGPAPWLRLLIFIVGTLGSVVLTLGVVVALGFSMVD